MGGMKGCQRDEIDCWSDWSGDDAVDGFGGYTRRCGAQRCLLKSSTQFTSTAYYKVRGREAKQR